MKAPESARVATELERAAIAFERETPLSRYTTMAIGGPADLLVRPTSAGEVLRTLELAAEHGLDVRVLGAGSNLLVSDAGVAGVVIHTAALAEVRMEESGLVEAGAGCHFPGLVRKTAAFGLRGLEAGVGIPGSLGGVLTMNAGAYEFSIGPLVEEVVAVSSSRGVLTLSDADIDFRYRSSSFGPDLIVAHARLALTPDNPSEIRADLDSRLQWRKQTQPVGVKSAGCIFKNPDGRSAGQLLDELGLKGLRVGGARLSEVHANFIVHDGGASADDVLGLIESIRERVEAETRIELEPEVMTWQ